MTNYILVHGGNVSGSTWNRCAQQDIYPADIKLGRQVWDEIARPLELSGHNVHTPTLRNEYQNNLSDHIKQICSLITEHQLEEVILVGHSYGGMIITGIANRAPDIIAQLVYIDAALPEDGQSLFDLLQLGGIDPSAIIQGNPKAYTEKLKLNTHPETKQPIKHYILCTESEFLSVSKFAKKKIFKNKAEWDYLEIDSGHLPMATEPKLLVNFLLDLADNYYLTKK